MRRRLQLACAILLGAAALAAPAPPGPRAEQDRVVVDRIVARIEGEIIVLSEVHELGRFQQLVEGAAEPYETLLNRLVDQWMVEREAAMARYPRPGRADVDKELARLQAGAGGEAAWRARLAELGLAESTVRRLVEAQIYLSRYLDYRFRPAAQVEPEHIEAYYRHELLPQLAARGQPAPPLEQVSEPIRELLTQREISRRAARWLSEARAQVRVEILPEGNR